tara:strand:- start:8944 stop:10032 length:1089 start_codon:yes stop_codon:yes gene_type:complete
VKTKIDPWTSGEIKDYSKVIKDFGLKEFTESEKSKFKHYFFKRNIILAHRDFDKIINSIERKKQFIQLTGVASSGPIHLGHKVDIDLFLFLRDLGGKSYLAVSDIDAYVSRPDSKIPDLETAKKHAIDNIAHFLALGVKKNELYLQSKKEARYYTFAFELTKNITKKTYEAIYGHLDLGKLSANFLQYADILHLQLKEYFGEMPSVTGIGLEQDPHARACRDLAKRLHYKLQLPSFIYFQHQSGLQEGKKMSASEHDTAIFLSDTEEQVRRKIKKAFSGGRKSLEEHRKLGGIPENDRAYDILKFHHPNDKFVEKIYNDYKSGRLLTGELKDICIDFLNKFLKDHHKKLKRTNKIAEKILLD